MTENADEIMGFLKKTVVGEPKKSSPKERKEYIPREESSRYRKNHLLKILKR